MAPETHGVPELRGAAAEAVAHRNGHVQIIASAGSGKTEVVSQRVASLVAEGVAPDSIVAFTFTKRAAAELKERIRQRVEARAGKAAVDLLGGLFVGTIHAYCFRLLQTYVPRYESYDPLDENQMVAFLQREGSRLGMKSLDPNNRLFAGIKAFASNAEVVENELLNVDDLADPFRGVLRNYYETLERYRLLSYGLQIVRTVEALEAPDLHAVVTSHVKHLIVDEYQDVNPAQERLIELLVKPRGQADLVVVGDDDQAIYQWRGSDVTNIVGFADRYPNVTSFELMANRRSRPTIVTLADGFAQTIPGRLPKSMTPVRSGDGPAVDVAIHDTELDEAEDVALTIEQLHAAGVPYRSMAVLVRGRAAYPRLLDAFEQYGVPVQPGGRTGLFDQPEADVLGRTYAWLADRDWRSQRFGQSTTVDFDDLCRDYARQFGLAPDVTVALYGHLVGWKQRVADTSRPVDLVGDFYDLLATVGASAWDTTEEAVRNRLGTLARFTSVLADYETVQRRARPDADVVGEQVGGSDRGIWYYKNLAALLTNYAHGAYEGFDGEPEIDIDAVDMTTVHAAKGLEWPVVFLPSLTGRRFPSSKTGHAGTWLVPRELFDAARYEGSDADERRLFYVALTRARDWVSLSAHERVNKNRGSISPYLTFCRDALNEPPNLPTLEPTALESALGDVILTYSELQSFLDCGFAYWLRSQLGFMPALAPELGYGKAVHHLMRAVAEHTQATGRPPRPQEVDHLLATEFYLPMANKPAHREMKQAARRLVYQYMKEYSSELGRVWATERPFELTLDGVVVSGRADVIFDEHDGVPTHLSIVDYKTSIGEATNGLQLQVYADAGRREGLEVVAAFVHDLKASERVDVSVQAADIDAAEHAVLVAADRLRQRDFVPNPSLTRCTRCDVRSLCRNAVKPDRTR